MTAPPDATDVREHGAEPTRDRDFPARRHIVPLPIAFPNIIGFSACTVAPGLEIRQATQADADRLAELNKTWSSTLMAMHTVPSPISSHVLCIDEQLYGSHIEQQIRRARGKGTEIAFKRLQVSDIYKMIVTALHLFCLVPLYVTQYYMTDEYDKDFHYLGFLKPQVQVIWESSARYAFPAGGYNLTTNGPITCHGIIGAVKVLEKYYQYNYWKGNRVAVALHNYWNALFVSESAIAFISLVAVIETFTNLDDKYVKDIEGTTKQIYRNTLKLAPVDGHGNLVTRERLKEIYKTRSVIVHGSYGRDDNERLGSNITHLDAKSSNVDIRLSTSVMSITAKLFHRVLFDPKIMSLLEGAKTSAQECRQLREHLNAMPSPEG